jgi:hypothetical protein
LIHLGYAIELDSKEIAMEALGLAATCYNFLHKYLDDPSYTQQLDQSSKSPLELLDKLNQDTRFDGLFDRPGSLDMERLFNEKEAEVLEYWNSWSLPNPTEQFKDSQLTAALLLSAIGTYDFFFVHTLTSSHAVRIILPTIPAEYHVPLVRQWWLIVLGVYITQGRPKIDRDSVKKYDLKGRYWSWVDKQGLESKWSLDAHYVKALRALKEAAQTWGDPDQIYLKSAVKFADNFTGWFGFASDSEEDRWD